MNQSATLEEVVEVGGVITDREPLDFYRLGLAGCIDRLTGPLRRQGTCVHWETPHHGVEISSGCASLLYQSAQEALSNTFKHAHATDVTVRLAAVFHGIRLMVADNGAGFETVFGETPNCKRPRSASQSPRVAASRTTINQRQSNPPNGRRRTWRQLPTCHLPRVGNPV